jgi:hypothetical protein
MQDCKFESLLKKEDKEENMEKNTRNKAQYVSLKNILKANDSDAIDSSGFILRLEQLGKVLKEAQDLGWKLDASGWAP